MASKILIIAIIVIALGGALFLYHWSSSGGIKLPSIFSATGTSAFNFSTKPNTPNGPMPPGGRSPSSNPSNLGNGSGSGYGSGSGSTGSLIVNTSTINPKSIPAGFTAAQLSPYFGDVRFGGVTAGGSYYGSYGTIRLYSFFRNNATGSIDITGWQIKSRRGGEFIPQAINLYDPSGMSQPTDIFMEADDNVSLFSSPAPFNLRLNKCIGYLSKAENFRPALPLSCPLPNYSQIANFSGACQNYIESLTGCQQPNLSSQQLSNTDYACRDYLANNFNYDSCFHSHVADANFLSNQVWIWTGSNVVDPQHDVVDLFDRSGLLVDQYSY